MVSFKDAKGKVRRNRVHASQLVLVSDPYPEAKLLDVNDPVPDDPRDPDPTPDEPVTRKCKKRRR